MRRRNLLKYAIFV